MQLDRMKGVEDILWRIKNSVRVLMEVSFIPESGGITTQSQSRIKKFSRSKSLRAITSSISFIESDFMKKLNLLTKKINV